MGPLSGSMLVFGSVSLFSQLRTQLFRIQGGKAGGGAVDPRIRQNRETLPILRGSGSSVAEDQATFELLIPRWFSYFVLGVYVFTICRPNNPLPCWMGT